MSQISSPRANLNEGEPLLGKAGIVTGAGTGIGRAIATRLAKLGADVGVNYFRSEEGAEETRERIIQAGRRAILLQCDVSKEDQVKLMVEKAHREFGRIDFLVNNATGALHAISDIPIVNRAEPLFDVRYMERWNRVIDVDLTGSLLCIRHVAPIMLAAKSGRIVNISSVAAITGDDPPGYTAAKAGLLGLTRSLAVRFAPYVQVNAILPGFVSSLNHDSELVAKVTPGKRMGTPDDIAEVVADVISAKSNFLTGSCIVVDGGVTSGAIGLSLGWVAQRE